jgi:glycosyltransferase involved in cell wall biosynthesis
VRVLLRPSEAWDHSDPPADRVAEIRAATSALDPADVTLLVSVAGGQCRSLLPEDGSEVVTWVVEVGEDLHWLDPPVDVASMTTTWWAGSRGSAVELAARVPTAAATLVPEFVEAVPVAPSEVARCRDVLTGGTRRAVAVGAGIGTFRKGSDLFLEVALAHVRRHGSTTAFTWIGGEDDELAQPLRTLSVDLGLDEVVRWVPSVTDLDTWLAAADVFVHPARLDSFPLVCLHAAAAGTPVIGFRGTGVEEMFGDDFLGVPYPAVHELADLVEAGRRDGSLRAAGERQAARIRASHVADAAGPVALAALRAAGRQAVGEGAR